MKPYIFHIISVFAFFIFPQASYCQQSRPIECGTPTPQQPFIIPDDAMHAKRSMLPYMMRIFVHIVANSDGTNIACGDSTMLRQLENMQEFYAPQLICFQLLGIQIINDSDLNNHNSDTEELDLAPYIVANTMNIFVHRDLFNNDGDLNGSAYSIPNTYLSVSRNAMTSITNRSTLAHEMGHCMGLYHTFEVSFDVEEIPRSGDCRNCDEAGDLLCDTNADPHSDEYDTGDHINASCNYTGSLINECDGVDYTYDMDPHNIMAYGRRECRDIFTNGQGNRLNATILTYQPLLDKIAPSSIVFNQNANTHITSGTFAHGAESSITVQGTDYEVSGNAHGFFNAPAISIKPQVHLHPGADGFCVFNVHNPTCD